MNKSSIPENLIKAKQEFTATLWATVITVIPAIMIYANDNISWWGFVMWGFIALMSYLDISNGVEFFNLRKEIGATPHSQH